MVCKEKITLLSTYVVLAQKFSKAISRLHEDAGALSHDEFELVYSATEDILQDVAAARIQFQAHIRTHGC
jgi:hypothetical protein